MTTVGLTFFGLFIFTFLAACLLLVCKHKELQERSDAYYSAMARKEEQLANYKEIAENAQAELDFLRKLSQEQFDSLGYYNRKFQALGRCPQCGSPQANAHLTNTNGEMQICDHEFHKPKEKE